MKSTNLFISLLVVLGVLTIAYWLSRSVFRFLDDVLWWFRYNWRGIIIGAVAVTVIAIFFSRQNQS